MRRIRTIAALVGASGIACLALMPATALAATWSYTTGPIQAAYNTSADLSVENDSMTAQTVNLGIFAGGNDDVMIGQGQTYTWDSDCTTGGGCLGPAIVEGATPDLVPSFYYTPLGSSAPTNVPAGGFMFGGPAGSLGDYLGAVVSLESSAGSEQALLSTTAGQVSGITGAVTAIQSALNGTNGALGTVGSAIEGVSTQHQIHTLGIQIGALQKQVSELTALLKPRRGTRAAGP